MNKTTTLRKDCIALHAELPLEQRATEQDLPERFSGPVKDTSGRLVEIVGEADEHGRYPTKEVHAPYTNFPPIYLHYSLFEDESLVVDSVTKPAKPKRGSTKTKA